MTIIHKGMRRLTTAVLGDYGQAHYLQNVRLKRVGEMGRRAGLGKSTMAQQAGPVQFMIGGWSNAPFIVNGTGGEVFGQEDPLAYWTGATLRIPGGEAAVPVAPVINSVTADPASPHPYPASTVMFTPDITYDGLSGPLTYAWVYNGGGIGLPPTPGSSTDPIFTTEFGVIYTAGTYLFQVQVATTTHGLQSNLFHFGFEIT